jgi:hypothetical protein
MSELPESIRQSLPENLIEEAIAWWKALSDSDRLELQKLCDLRKETFLFESFPNDGSGITVAGGKFIAHDDCIRIDEWGNDYFDYLMGNPELVLVHDPAQRTFHIGCTRHKDALRCYKRGTVPIDFTCPFGETACRMKVLLGNAVGVGLRRLKFEAATSR